MGFFTIGLEIGLGITFLSFAIFLFLSLNDSACNNYKDFKSCKYDYLVLDKYVDSTERSYRTLILQDSNGNKIKNIDLRMDYSGLFDFVKIGDSLRKKYGESLVSIINKEYDTIIAVDFNCDKK